MRTSTVWPRRRSAFDTLETQDTKHPRTTASHVRRPDPSSLVAFTGELIAAYNQLPNNITVCTSLTLPHSSLWKDPPVDATLVVSRQSLSLLVLQPLTVLMLDSPGPMIQMPASRAQSKVHQWQTCNPFHATARYSFKTSHPFNSH